MFSRNVGQAAFECLPLRKKADLICYEAASLAEIREMVYFFDIKIMTIASCSLARACTRNDRDLISQVMDSAKLDKQSRAMVLKCALKDSDKKTCKMLLDMKVMNPLDVDVLKVGFARGNTTIMKMVMNHPRLRSKMAMKHLADPNNIFEYLKAGVLSDNEEMIRFMVACPSLVVDHNVVMWVVSDTRSPRFSKAITEKQTLFSRMDLRQKMILMITPVANGGV